MKLYNTQTRQIQPVTSEDGIVRMYVCGITPYDTTHLGHAFVFVYFDVLERYLEFSGYQTLTVQNVTDIDDDILRRAKEVGLAWDELARQETQKFLTDLRALNVRMPDHYPHATEEIDKMVDIVSTLLDKGYAYERNGSIYYEVRRDPDFGKLSKMNYDEMLRTANERGNFPDDPNKRDPLDFVLWQAAKSGEPTWNSPWGLGRPGWHIECSAMSMRYLGPHIDIHSGGADLIFPHHECEIAQSEHYSGEEPFVRCWFHVAMVRLGGEKMSKSLGNMIFVRDLLQSHSPDAIRLYLLSHKYRDPWDADDAETELRAKEAMFQHWCQTAALPGTGGTDLDVAQIEIDFRAAMDDDLNTPRAIQHLETLANIILEGRRAGANIQIAQNKLRAMSEVLGLRLAVYHE